MILREGVLVNIRGDNSSLLRAFRGGGMASKAFAGTVVAALGAVAAQSVRMAAQLDKDLRLVATLGGEASGNIQGLRKEVQTLGREFGRNFNELARANYQAVSGGFKSIADSMALTRAGTRLAVAGNAELVGSTEAVVKALNAFGMNAGDAERASAQLWGITRDGIITVEQLSRFLSDLPVAMATSGIEFEEMSAAISTLTAAGVPASTAMDQLRSAIIQLERRGITGTLVERVERFAGQGIGELTTQLGDQTAARGVLVLAENLQTFRRNIEGAAEVTDDYNTAVETMTGGVLAEWAQIQETVNSAMQDLGASILPAVNRQLQDAKENFEIIERIIQRIRTGGPPATGLQAPNTSGVVLPVRDSNGNVIPVDTGGNNGAAGPVPVTIVGDNLPAFGSTVMGRRGAWTSSIAPRAAIDDRAMAWFDDIDIAGDMGKWEREMDAAMDSFYGVGDSAGQASVGAYVLANNLGNVLNVALNDSSNKVLNFVAVLAQIGAQIAAYKGNDKGALALSAVKDGLFAIAQSFNTGGYTGASGGVVHPNEYVFNPQAVQSIGLGRLDRMHQVAGAGNTSNTVNVTVNAGSGDASAIAQLTADAVGMKMRELSTTGRGNLYKSAPAKYGRR